MPIEAKHTISWKVLAMIILIVAILIVMTLRGCQSFLAPGNTATSQATPQTSVSQPAPIQGNGSAPPAQPVANGPTYKSADFDKFQKSGKGLDVEVNQQWYAGESNDGTLKNVLLSYFSSRDIGKIDVSLSTDDAGNLNGSYQLYTWDTSGQNWGPKAKPAGSGKIYALYITDEGGGAVLEHMLIGPPKR
jgi:hypothetical protein